MTIKAFIRVVYKKIPWKVHAFKIMRSIYVPPKHIWEHLYFDGDFEFEINGKAYIMTNYDSPLETAIFWAGIFNGYEPVSQQLWIHLCERAETILDIGANTALYSLIAKGTNSSAEVWCFEPIARIYDRMMKNIIVNGLNIRHKLYAISDKDEEAIIYDLPYDHHYHASLDKEELLNKGIQLIQQKVQVRRLDTVIAEEIKKGVDLIKIDTEGNEPLVLRGMGEYLTSMKPTILLEVKSAVKAQQIEDLLYGLGYKFFTIDEEYGITRVDHMTPHRGGLNVLICSPEVACDLEKDFTSLRLPR